MRSTGEVLGIDARFGAAFAKSQEAAYGALPAKGVAFLSVRNADKRAIVLPAKRLADLGFTLVATTGTAGVLRRNGMDADRPQGPRGARQRGRQDPGREIDLVVNTPAGPGARRTATTSASPPWPPTSPITTLSGLTAVVQGIEARLAGDLAVRPLQAWHDGPAGNGRRLRRRRAGGRAVTRAGAVRGAGAAGRGLPGPHPGRARDRRRPPRPVRPPAGRGGPLVPLRRPFSIHRVERPGVALGTVEVVFDVVGAGTLALSRPAPATWSTCSGRSAGRSTRRRSRPAACWSAAATAPAVLPGHRAAGAALPGRLRDRGGHRGRLLDAMEAKQLGHSLTVTTDDGSAGRRGLVTDPLPDLLARTGAARVYACGPMPMLAAVSRLAAAAGVPCQVAVEEQMACGTGICFSCVLPSGVGGRAGPGGGGRRRPGWPGRAWRGRCSTAPPSPGPSWASRSWSRPRDRG